MAREVYSNVIAKADPAAAGVLSALSNVQITVKLAGTGTNATIYKARTGATQGPTTASGATGTNPFVTGATGAVEFFADPGEYDILVHDLQGTPRIADYTLAWNSLYDVPLYSSGLLSARPAGIAGQMYFATDEGILYFYTGAAWIATSGLLGDLKFSARAAEHQNWIKADGRTLAAGQYPQLRALLAAEGNLYGSPPGGGTILLPDLRGRAAIGVGTPAGASGATAHAHGQKDGHETHTLTAAQIPAHSHPLSGYTILHSIPAGWHTDGDSVTQYNYVGGATTLNSTGGDQPHANMQPYTVGNWFIYAGPAT